MRKEYYETLRIAEDFCNGEAVPFDEPQIVGCALAVALEAMQSWSDFTAEDFIGFLRLEISRQEAMLNMTDEELDNYLASNP